MYEVWLRPLWLRLLALAWLGLSAYVATAELGLFAGSHSPVASFTEGQLTGQQIGDSPCSEVTHVLFL
jgi:hypothetical protein